MKSRQSLTSAVIYGALAVVLLPLTGCAQDRLGEGSTQEFSLTFENLPRSYKLYTPGTPEKQEPMPLVVAIHGLSQSPDDLARLTGFNLEADDHGFLVVYPAAYQGNWNDRRDVEDVPAYELNVDDTAYIREVVARISATNNVDPNRIYAAGMSNGGMMVYRLAFQAADLFAGFASVVASIPVNQTAEFTTTGPVNMFITAGNADPILPYEGGEVMGEFKSLGIMHSVPDSVGFWVALNECDPDPSITQLPNRETLNRTVVSRAVYNGCKPGGDVVFYGVEGGGHTWSGGPASEASRAQGPISDDFDATEVIVDFFLARSRDKSE